MGPIVNQTSCSRTIQYSRGIHLRSPTIFSWGLHSKMQRELIVGLLVVGFDCIGLGHTHLGDRTPFAPAPHPCLMIGSCALFALLLVIGIPWVVLNTPAIDGLLDCN